MPERHMPSALKFRRVLSELSSLETLASTCDVVVQVSVLVHALQKERGYSNLYLCSVRPDTQPTLVALSQDAAAIETQFREFLDAWRTRAEAGSGRARLLNCIAHALFRLDEIKPLRRRVHDRDVPVIEADTGFTQIIAGLLAIVFEAADSALDPGITRMMVALLNAMQGKELSGQERACGVMGYTAGYFSDAQKARMLGLAAHQARSFSIFLHYAQDDVRQSWEQTQQHAEQVFCLRDMAQRTAHDQQVDSALAELWFDACTARINAMHAIERDMAAQLAHRCQQRIAETRQELDDHRLLLSRHTEHATGRVPNVVFSVQSRIVDVPPEDGMSDELTRPILDLMHEQTLRLQRADAALAEVRSVLDEKKQVDRAKSLLMHRYRLSEHDAHERLQRAAMNGGLSLADVARQIVDAASRER